MCTENSVPTLPFLHFLHHPLVHAEASPAEVEKSFLAKLNFFLIFVYKKKRKTVAKKAQTVKRKTNVCFTLTWFSLSHYECELSTSERARGGKKNCLETHFAY